MRSILTTLTVATLVALGVANQVDAQTTGGITATIDGPAVPSPTPVPGVVAWGARFTAPATPTGPVVVGFDLLGTNGEGTFNSVGPGASFTNCVIDPATRRTVRCDWDPAASESAVLAVVINVGAGATPPDWTFDAVVQVGNAQTVVLATARLPIPTTSTTAAPTTAAPTTATPTTAAPTTAAPTTAAPTTVATTTPSGNGGTGTGGAGTPSLPATGNTDAGLVWVAGAMLAMGGAFIAASRRRSNSTA